MLILLTYLAFALHMQAQEAQPHFLTDFPTAQDSSARSGKPILMVFSGSDWCKPCILLKKDILHSPEFTAFSEERLVVLNLDFPFRKKNALAPDQKAHNEALAAKYNPDGAFPKVLLVNNNGEVLRSIPYKLNSDPETFLAVIKN